MSSNIVMKIFLTNPNAVIPTYGTRFAACFDLSGCLKGVEHVTVYTKDNEKVSREIDEETVVINPGERALIPTGIIFNLPPYFSMRVHPRSGLSLKNGITLCNCEGVIDPDYVNETFITLFNVSNVPFVVKHGDRLAQGEIVDVSNQVASFHAMREAPRQKGDRNGGFGHTGVAA